jgi:hypothetical protein
VSPCVGGKTGVFPVQIKAFSSEACPGLDPGWIPVRAKKTRQNKVQASRF